MPKTPEAPQDWPEFLTPVPYWVTPATLDEKGPNAGFQMFTRNGNNAAAACVKLTIEATQACGLTRDEMLDLLNRSRHYIARVHSEIYDSEPRGFTVDAMNHGLRNLGLPDIREIDL